MCERGFYIGNVIIENPVILAPMAGITDSVFRRIAKRFGCSLVYTELISSLGLVYSDSRSFQLARFSPQEKPIAIQIFGDRPEEMASAARIVEELGADIVDINLGCSVRKMARSGGGIYLTRNFPLLCNVLARVVESVRIPVTIKLRKGWSDEEITAINIAKEAENIGVAAIAIHGRTGKEGFKKKADWNIVRQLVSALKIPVLGSGDIFQAKDIIERQEQTGCQGIIVARGVLGNPWLIREAVHLTQYNTIIPPPTLEEKKQLILEHIDEMVKEYGEQRGIMQMRKHMAWYIKGMPDSSYWKPKFFSVSTYERMKQLIEIYFSELAGRQRR